MLRTYFLLFIFTCIANITVAQPTEQQIQTVLNADVKDSLFVFDSSTKQGKAINYNTVELIYFGIVTTNGGATYKILTRIYTFGIGPHHNNRVIIYNDKNQYVGQYHMYAGYDLPTKMINGVLYFNNNGDGSCDKGTRFKLDLKRGLPKEFFLPCRGNSGDFYSFSSGD